MSSMRIAEKIQFSRGTWSNGIANPVLLSCFNNRRYKAAADLQTRLAAADMNSCYWMNKVNRNRKS
ncbi:hypothetical protein TSUD_184500 [Trifolium subterraneum]|uniref:Uncharacterized protein n=1 Tax=Trifolium subterraneum TaxID=3900 RepID=A0A2Z6PBL5_TRISU|nr:hypothetical protein TSUD_184500 [Trifolium subterraneum]